MRHWCARWNAVTLASTLLAGLFLQACKTRSPEEANSAALQQANPDGAEDGEWPSFEAFMETSYTDLADHLKQPMVVAALRPEIYGDRLTEEDLAACSQTAVFNSIDDATTAFYSSALVRGRIAHVESVLTKVPPTQRQLWSEYIKSLKALLPFAKSCDSRMEASARYLVETSRYAALTDALTHMKDTGFSMADSYMKPIFEQPIYYAIINYAAHNSTPVDDRLIKKIESVSGKQAGSFATDRPSIETCRTKAPSLLNQPYTDNPNDILAYLECLHEIERRRLADRSGPSFRLPSRARQVSALEERTWTKVQLARNAIKSGRGPHK